MRTLRTRISTKLIGAVVAIVLLSFALLTWSLQRGASNALLAASSDALEGLRTSRGNSVERYFEQMRGSITAAARAVVVRNAITTMPRVVHAALASRSTGDIARRADYAPLYQNIRQPALGWLSSFHWDDFVLVDMSGIVMFSAAGEVPVGTDLRKTDSQNQRLASAFEAGARASRDQVQFVDFSALQTTGKSAAFFSAPITSDSSLALLGVLIANVSNAEVNAIMTEHSGLGRTGETYIVGPDTVTRTDSRFAGQTGLRRRVVTDATREALSGHTGQRTLQDYRGIRVLSAYAPLDVGGTRWAVIAEADYSEIVAASRTLSIRALWILLGMSVGGGLLLIVTLRNVVLKPIVALANAARNVESGGLQTEVPVASTDELGQLGQAFNSMVRSVERQVTEVRQAHESIAQKEAEFHALVDNVSGVVYRCLPESPWKLLFVSEQVRDLTGYAAEEFLAKDSPLNLGNIMHADDIERVTSETQIAIDGNQQYVLQYRVIDREGRLRYILDQGRATYGTDGKPVDLFGTLFDETQRRQAEDAVTVQRRKFEEILNTTPVGVAIIVNRVYRLVNPTYRKLLADVGDPSGLRLTDEQLDFIRSRLAAGESIRDFQFSTIGRDGQPLVLMTSFNNIEYAGDPGILIWAVDITRLKDTELLLEKAREAAETAAHAKSDFLANMSHEIRTPMNAILGMTHLALKTELTSQQRDYLTKAHRAADALLGIVDDVLDFSKIEAGRLEMEEVDFSLDDVLEDVASLTAYRAEQKGLELLVRCDSNVPQRLRGDPLRLGQIFTNLISNAVKFADHSEITVSVAVERLSSDGVTLRCSVRDRGIGMTAEQADKLFQPFSQADTSTTRKYGGTGLGLSIVKRLAELMKGRVWVESELGRGSTFSFTADFGIGDAASEDERATPGDLAGLRVLVVDDNPNALEIMQNMVGSMGFDVTLSASGYDALGELAGAKHRKPFDLVICDWRMPGLDGVQTIERIRGESETYGSPRVILVSAYGQPDSTAHGGASADAFASKPVTSSTLFDTILRTFGKGAARPSRRRTAFNVEQATQLDGKRVLLVEDNEINQQLAREMLESSGIVVTVVNNGSEAVDAVRNGTYDAVLMDVQMPVMDGYEATRRIRADVPGGANIPVIAMTAHAMVGDAQKSVAAGMNDHVTKPIDSTILLGTVLRWVSSPGAPAAAGATAPVSVARAGRERSDGVALPESIAGIDMKGGLGRAGGNTRLYRDVLRRFRDDFADTASALREHVAAARWQDVGHLAHGLAGVAGNIGATRVHAAAIEVERAVRGGHPDRAAEYVPTLVTLLGETLDGLVVLTRDEVRPTDAAATLPATALDGCDVTFRSELRAAATAADQERVEEIIAGCTTLPNDVAAALRMLATNLDFGAIRALVKPVTRPSP